MNNTTFIEYTSKYNNFSISKDEAKQYLLDMLQKNNLSNLNNIHEINYEKFIFIDFLYSPTDDFIHMLVEQVKEKISKNYLYKNQLLNRLILKQEKNIQNNNIK